jgi:hypothetical protein
MKVPHIHDLCRCGLLSYPHCWLCAKRLAPLRWLP